MMILRPHTLFSTLECLYRKNATSLTLKIKSFVLVLVVLLFLDNIYGLSHALCINTQMDNIERAEKLFPSDYKGALVEQKEQLVKEIIQRKNIIQNTKEMLIGEKVENSRISFWNYITAGFLPIIFILICLYYLTNAIIIKRKNQIEHVVNLLIMTTISLVLFYFMVDLSSVVPQLLEETNTWNIVINIVMNIILYIVICALVTVLSKVTISLSLAEDGTASIERLEE